MDALKKVAIKAKRIWIEIVIMLVMFSLSFLLPATKDEAEQAGSLTNLLALFVVKTNSALWGLLLVDLFRKWKWQYLDLKVMVERGQWSGVLFLLGIYVIVIYAMAAGG
jgi:hypothetical protein